MQYPYPHYPYENMHHPHPQSDMEGAFVVAPHEECCPSEGDKCECVTSGDIEKWNFAYDAVKDFSGINPEDLEAYTQIAKSADLWNSTYDVVSTNSGKWNEIVTIDDAVKNLTSAVEQNTDDNAALKNETSAINSAVNNISSHLYFDRDIDTGSISGDGSKGLPYGVRDYARISRINKDLNDIYEHTIIGPASSDWAGLYRFDGDAFWYDKLENETNALNKKFDTTIVAYSAFDKDLTLVENDLKTALARFRQTIGDDVWTHADDTPSGTTTVVHLTEKAVQALKKASSAMDYIEGLGNFNPSLYAQFKPMMKHPTSEKDLAGYTAPNTIYYIAG